MITLDTIAGAIRVSPVIAFASIVLTRSIPQDNYGTILVAQKKRNSPWNLPSRKTMRSLLCRSYKRGDKSGDTRIDVSRRQRITRVESLIVGGVSCEDSILREISCNLDRSLDIDNLTHDHCSRGQLIRESTTNPWRADSNASDRQDVQWQTEPDYRTDHRTVLSYTPRRCLRRRRGRGRPRATELRRSGSLHRKLSGSGSSAVIYPRNALVHGARYRAVVGGTVMQLPQVSRKKEGG